MLELNHELKKATIRGLATAWIEGGQRGRPVFFLCHGFPDSPEVWRPQIEVLSREYHVIAPYVRGCEDSVGIGDLRRYGRDAVLLDHLEILRQACGEDAQVICAGHDLGVVHAMTLARALGSRCAGLVCINGLDIEMFARRLRDPGQVARSWYMGLMQLPFIPEVMVGLIPRTCLTLAGVLAGGIDTGHDAATKFSARASRALNQYRAFVGDLRHRSEPHKRLDCPVLIVWGRDDGVLLPPTEDEWRMVCQKPVLRIIPGGHWLHRDEAPVINGFLEEFARECLPRMKGECDA